MPQLCGNDRHPGALAIAQKAIAAAGLGAHIRLDHGDARSYEPPFRPGFVATNPPWGDRLQEDPELLIRSWRALGAFLHEQCRGAVAWVLCGERELTRHLGLRSSARHPIRTGPVECRWLRYEVAG